MAGFLGIDHPLIVVGDIAAMRERYAALGFTMTPIGKHPWGTSTSLAMFDRCLLELMSIYDESLIDISPAGDFRFGRLIRDHLTEREGISMQALNSDDAEGDAAIVRRAAFAARAPSSSAVMSRCRTGGRIAPRRRSRFSMIRSFRA